MSQLPPHNLDAERGLIGSILRERAALGRIAELISAESFYLDANQMIYRMMVELDQSGKPPDLVAVAELLASRKQAENVGGMNYLVKCWEDAPTAANAEHYAAIVREKSDVRQLIGAATGILRDCYGSIAPADDLISAAQREIMAVGQGAKKSENHHLKTVLHEVLTEFDKRSSSEDSLSGVPSGLVDLDRLTGGFHPGELIIISARPSVGKTSLAATIAKNAAAMGRGSLIFSLEQSRGELATRLLCGETWINSSAFRTVGRGSRMGPDRIEKLIDASHSLGKLPIWINDTPSQRTRLIASATRRLMMRESIRMIMIDYLQLVEHEGERGAGLVERVANSTRGLKLLARELGVPVVCLSQLSRNCEQERRRPRLSDLRDSGAIEQDADTVIFLHRPGEKDESILVESIEAIVEKQRNGPCGIVTLAFRKSAMRFENYSDRIPR